MVDESTSNQNKNENNISILRLWVGTVSKKLISYSMNITVMLLMAIFIIVAMSTLGQSQERISSLRANQYFQTTESTMITKKRVLSITNHSKVKKERSFVIEAEEMTTTNNNDVEVSSVSPTINPKIPSSSLLFSYNYNNTDTSTNLNYTSSLSPSSSPIIQMGRVSNTTNTALTSSAPSSSSAPSAKPANLPTHYHAPTIIIATTNNTKSTDGNTIKPSKISNGNTTFQVELAPTFKPSIALTSKPSLVPTSMSSLAPTVIPSLEPTGSPSKLPTFQPSAVPTSEPSLVPTSEPSSPPTAIASNQPSMRPSTSPSTTRPTMQPSSHPTATTTCSALLQPQPQEEEEAFPEMLINDSTSSNTTMNATFTPLPYSVDFHIQHGYNINSIIHQFEYVMGRILTATILGCTTNNNPPEAAQNQAAASWNNETNPYNITFVTFTGLHLFNDSNDEKSAPCYKQGIKREDGAAPVDVDLTTETCSYDLKGYINIYRQEREPLLLPRSPKHDMELNIKNKDRSQEQQQEQNQNHKIRKESSTLTSIQNDDNNNVPAATMTTAEFSDDQEIHEYVFQTFEAIINNKEFSHDINVRSLVFEQVGGLVEIIVVRTDKESGNDKENDGLSTTFPKEEKENDKPDMTSSLLSPPEEVIDKNQRNRFVVYAVSATCGLIVAFSLFLILRRTNTTDGGSLQRNHHSYFKSSRVQQDDEHPIYSEEDSISNNPSSYNNSTNYQSSSNRNNNDIYSSYSSNYNNYYKSHSDTTSPARNYTSNSNAKRIKSESSILSSSSSNFSLASSSSSNLSLASSSHNSILSSSSSTYLSVSSTPSKFQSGGREDEFESEKYSTTSRRSKRKHKLKKKKKKGDGQAFHDMHHNDAYADEDPDDDSHSNINYLPSSVLEGLVMGATIYK